MDLFFFGAGQYGLAALEKYNQIKSDTVVFKGFIDNKKSGTWGEYPIFNLGDIKYDDCLVVITMENHFAVCDVYSQLKNVGIKKVYWFMNWEYAEEGAEFLDVQCINCTNWGDAVLPRLEMHIADHCNLNCKGCTHYAPLFEKKLPDRNEVIFGLKMLVEKLSNIAVLSILGGEPFLNPEIQLYIKEIRSILPNTYIQIVTNGLLIPFLGDEVLKCIADNNVLVRISEYKPTVSLRDRIEKKLRQYKITYRIQPYDDKQKFVKPLSLSENSIYPKKCISNGCVNIWNGKIARCPSLMFIEKFNEVFETKLPVQGIMSLETCPSGKKLLDMLNEEVPLCKHCVYNEMDWGQCTGEPQLEDFATDK